MASSRKLPSVEERIRKNIADTLLSIGPADTENTVCVAFSGGLDSSVLLDACVCLLSESSSPTFRLVAFHLNHGLSPNARNWQAHCQAVCQHYGIPLNVAHADLKSKTSGIELAARLARYDAFYRIEATHILLAHHQDDQAETVLHNLFRGSGVLGAAGVPRQQGRILRPLLSFSRNELHEYAQLRDLKWIEDESNDSTRFSRNYLRQAVLPAIKERFPAAAKELSVAAQNFADAQQLLADIAIEDGAGETPLPLTVLRQVNAEKGTLRSRNLLLAHLRLNGIRIPSREWFDEAFRQLLSVKPDAQLVLRAGKQLIRHFQGKLHVCPESEVVTPQVVPWRPNGTITLSWGPGEIVATIAKGTGLSRQYFQCPMEFRPRLGGERLFLRGMHRQVKDLLREAGIPTWERGQLPILFRGNDVVWIPGIGIAENYRCLPEEEGIALEFVRPNW